MKYIILLLLSLILNSNFYAASPEVFSFDAKFISEKINKNPPIKIKLSVKNTGGKILTVIKADLLFPDFFKYKSEINKIQIKENIKPGDVIVFEWNFNYDQNIKQKIDLKAVVTSYGENNNPIKKDYDLEVYLTKGEDLSTDIKKISSLKFSEIIIRFLTTEEILKLYNDELNEINFYIEKLNLATDIEAFISGNKTIPPTLILELDERFKLILKNIEERKKELNKLLQKYQYID